MIESVKACYKKCENPKPLLAELDKNQEMFPPAGGYLYVPVFLWKCMWRGAQIPKKPGTVRSVTCTLLI
jgi:hypothetical protein